MANNRRCLIGIDARKPRPLRAANYAYAFRYGCHHYQECPALGHFTPTPLGALESHFCGSYVRANIESGATRTLTCYGCSIREQRSTTDRTLLQSQNVVCAIIASVRSKIRTCFTRCRSFRATIAGNKERGHVEHRRERGKGGTAQANDSQSAASSADAFARHIVLAAGKVEHVKRVMAASSGREVETYTCGKSNALRNCLRRRPTRVVSNCILVSQFRARPNSLWPFAAAGVLAAALSVPAKLARYIW